MIEAILWLVINLYHEARGEPLEAQVASVHVVMNRADWEYKNVPGVIRKRLQFSWTRDKRKLAEAKQIVREGVAPARMKNLIGVVYKAINVPHNERPIWTHYKAITSTSTWGCYPGGVTTKAFVMSGHTFCGDIDVVKPGQIPDYIKTIARLKTWKNKGISVTKVIEYGITGKWWRLQKYLTKVFLGKFPEVKVEGE